MADALTPVLTSREAMQVVMIADESRSMHFRGTSNWAAHIARAVERAVLTKLAAQAPAQPAEAVGTLSIQRFRGHLENASFDYTGALPDGDYALYTHPAPSQPGRAVMQQALEALEVCRDSFQRIREAGGHSTSAEIVAETAIAALSATMEKP